MVALPRVLERPTAQKKMLVDLGLERVLDQLAAALGESEETLGASRAGRRASMCAA